MKILLALSWLSLTTARFRGRGLGVGMSTSNNILFQLGKHEVYTDKITLSGFSSGGTFAQQMFIAYSSLFAGIATFSHAYYRCGPGNGREDEYDNACTTVGMNQTGWNPENALKDIRTYEQRRLIDNTGNLRNKRLFVYAGSRSSFFNLDQSLGAVRIFEPFIQNPHNIWTKVQDAAQLLPSDRFGGPCTMDAAQNYFVGNCGYLGASEALRFLLGDSVRYPSQMTRPRLRQLLMFDQTEFFYGHGNAQEYMDQFGYIYVPRNCHRQRCLLHFYFHGCLTGREFNGTDHIVNSGYLEVAEANNMIIVFPQAWSSAENMIGCWDTYGLTSSLYATQQGAQVSVVRNMLSRILGMDNEVEREAEPNIKLRDRQSLGLREPLGIEFEIVKGREVYLR